MQDALNQNKKEENILSGTLVSCPVAGFRAIPLLTRKVCLGESDLGMALSLIQE